MSCRIADLRVAVALTLVALGTSITNAEPPAGSLIVETPNASSTEENASVVLNGGDSRWQIRVSRNEDAGRLADVSREASYTVEPAGIITVDSSGYVRPVSDGVATVTASLGDQTAIQRIEVHGMAELQPVSFPNQVVPVLTKHGCNGGGCHGKSTGQAGFMLSLLGFDPKADFEHIVQESRGRRVFPRLPERSLLIEKAVNRVAHGGGMRIEPDSDDYRLLVRWIATGMPYGNADDPTVREIAVYPRDRVVRPNSSQQLQVVAIYTDGRVEDITRTAEFEVNKDDLATVDANGLVTLKDRTGDVAVMTRYQGLVAVFRATIPLGVPVETWPEERSFVDTQVFNKLKQLGVPASGICDDSTFIRRATLDIAGRLPTLEETKQFLSGDASTKRDELVDRLLSSTDYATYFARKWSAILRNQRPGAGHTLRSFAFHDWVRDSLHTNKPYDQFVREIVAARGTVETNPAVAWLQSVTTTESRLEDAAQLFLGQRLQCAKCHHHPYEKWSQEDYYKMAAFFAKVATKEGSVPEEPFFFSRRGTATARHPRTGQNLEPAGLDAETLKLDANDDPREALVDWMAQPDNKFFAKSLVNRYWKHFFGQGVVEPEDDMRITNPATNPELLDELAKRFVESDFDLKWLVRTICTSTAYQLDSGVNAHNQSESNSFARYYPKRLQAEVLLDAINRVTESTTRFDGLPEQTKAVSLPDTGFSSYFLTVFGEPDSMTACECERSDDATLAQSLHLLNSKEVQDKLKSDTGRAARLSQQDDDPQAVADLYLTMFSRPPTSDEMDVAVGYVSERNTDRKAAFEDLTWALINTKEFLFNH